MIWNWTVTDLMQHSYKRKWVARFVHRLWLYTHRQSVRVIDDHMFVMDGKTYMQVKFDKPVKQGGLIFKE